MPYTGDVRMHAHARNTNSNTKGRKTYVRALARMRACMHPGKKIKKSYNNLQIDASNRQAGAITREKKKLMLRAKERYTGDTAPFDTSIRSNIISRVRFEG